MDRSGMTSQSVAPGREDLSRHHLQQHHSQHHPQHHPQHQQWSGHPLPPPPPPPPPHSYPTEKDGSGLLRPNHPGTLINNTGGPFFPLDFPGPADNADFPGRPADLDEEGPSRGAGPGRCMGAVTTLHPNTCPTTTDRQRCRPGHTSKGHSASRKSSTEDISNPARRMRRRELSQFSPEEADRIVRRRERNKVAATKCRHKRRAQHEELVKELQDMECENTSLTYEIRQLQRQRQALSDVLRHHQMSCPSRLQFDMTDMQSVHKPGGPGDSLSGPYPLTYTR